MFISYAQNCEDVLLNRIFKDQKSGFYIDVGAHHPINDSITKSFYDRGWKGINVEPVKEFFDLLEKERTSDLNLNFAISDSEEKLDFFELLGTGLSTFNADMAKELAQQRSLTLSQYTVSTKTLANICRQYVSCPIDFLKIDVEGWEEKVILGHDWEHFRPKIVIVEATIPDSPIRCQTQIPAFLKERNYQQVYFDGLNDFYIAEEVHELAQYFQTPVNVFDNFVSFKVIDQQQHIHNLETFLKRKDDEILSLMKQIKESDRLLAILKNEKEDQSFEISRLRELLTKVQTENNQQIQAYEKQICDLHSKIQALKSELFQSQQWVKAMESSKFWKLRKRWFSFKEKVGLPSD
jgi:FkbM family methyltransferase